MTEFMHSLRARLQRRAAYSTTLHELRALPMDLRIDLDIAGIEDKVARQAVYG